MIFTTNGASSYFIDVDLTQKEGEECYPLGYNTTGIARHPDAIPGKPMKKEHDRYALAEVIKTVVCPKCAAAEKKQLLALVTDAAVSLETVSTYLSKLTFNKNIVIASI